MKQVIIFLMMLLMLTGCAAQPTYETVNDDITIPEPAQMGQTFVELPAEAASPTIESGSERLYMCGNYEIRIQTMESGDLESTVQAVSGYTKDRLTIMETQRNGMPCYEFVWASAGDEGEQVGRAAVLDDGNYHYCVTTMTDAASAVGLEAQWSRIFGSMTLA
jgi:hypothetical protein